MSVMYSWTEGGVPERCEVSVGEGGGVCYHCGRPMDGACVRLDAPDGDTYLMHRECAYDGCGGLDRAVIDAIVELGPSAAYEVWRVTILADDGRWVPVEVEARCMEEAVAAVIDAPGVANVIECERAGGQEGGAR